MNFTGTWFSTDAFVSVIVYAVTSSSLCFHFCHTVAVVAVDIIVFAITHAVLMKPFCFHFYSVAMPLPGYLCFHYGGTLLSTDAFVFAIVMLSGCCHPMFTFVLLPLLPRISLLRQAVTLFSQRPLLTPFVIWSHCCRSVFPFLLLPLLNIFVFTILYELTLLLLISFFVCCR